jgi:hypothetical protein
MKQVTIDLRGKTYTGSITDADGIVFLSVLFNNAELDLLEKGKGEEALSRFQSRYITQISTKLDKAKRREQEEEKINLEIAQVIYQRIQRHTITRSLIAARICECLPEMEESLVYWKSESKFGIRLDSAETMELFMSIIKPVLADAAPEKQMPAIAPKKKVIV